MLAGGGQVRKGSGYGPGSPWSPCLSAGILVGTEDPREGQGREKNGWASLKTGLWMLVKVGKKGQAGFRASVRVC